MSLDYFKEDIREWAVQNYWRMDQIQYAEDYIEKLNKKGIKAKPHRDLDPEKAAYIKTEFSKKSD